MSLELNVQGLAAVAALAEARKVQAAAEDAAKEAAKAVKALLGDERVGTIAGVTVVEIKEIERHGIDAKRLRQDDPALADRYDTVSTYDKIVLA